MTNKQYDSRSYYDSLGIEDEISYEDWRAQGNAFFLGSSLAEKREWVTLNGIYWPVAIVASAINPGFMLPMAIVGLIGRFAKKPTDLPKL